jgi:phytoene/squalene synthetase
VLATPELEIARRLPAQGCSVEEAQRYTRWLATHHYENFNVVSWLLPRRLHQHFYNLYAYCRWSDDLGDEVPTVIARSSCWTHGKTNYICATW